MELEFIEWLRTRVPPRRSVPVGIGDDAAVIATPGELAVLTSDMLMDGVDFRLGHCELPRVGRKSLAVNLSDVAAMACTPVAAIVSLAIPEGVATPLAQSFYEGLLPLAEAFGVSVAGGDTNTWAGPLVVSITILGSPVGSGPLLRSTGQIGDQLLVTGAFGGSILGRHFDFNPRVKEAIWLREHEDLHAAIDVSDGLSLDLSRLARASGCGAEVELAQVPITQAAHDLAGRDGEPGSPLDHALEDGEDFELIIAVPQPTADRLLASQPLQIPLTRIGQLVEQPGLWRVAEDGSRSPLEPRGYRH